MFDQRHPACPQNTLVNRLLCVPDRKIRKEDPSRIGSTSNGDRPPPYLQLPISQCFESHARLHRRLRQVELPDCPSDIDSLRKAIFARTGTEAGWTIYQELQKYLPSERSHITGFRVSVSYSFTDDDHVVCTLVEWREQCGTDALAIFDVAADDPTRYNYIIHYGKDANLKPLDQFQWSSTSIEWDLSAMGELQTLLKAVQHVLGIMEMPKDDLEVLYVGNRNLDCCRNEYEAAECDTNMGSVRNYAGLLFEHFLRIEQVERLIEPAKQVLEDLTSVHRSFP